MQYDYNRISEYIRLKEPVLPAFPHKFTKAEASPLAFDHQEDLGLTWTLCICNNKEEGLRRFRHYEVKENIGKIFNLIPEGARFTTCSFSDSRCISVFFDEEQVTEEQLLTIKSTGKRVRGFGEPETFWP